MRNILFLLSTTTQLFLYGQPFFEDESNSSMVPITDTTNSDIISRFLEANNYRNIEFNKNKQSLFCCRIQLNNGDWRLYGDYDELICADLKSLEGYSYSFPSPIMEYYEFTWLYSEEGCQVVSFYSTPKKPYKILWDTIIIKNHSKMDSLIIEYDEIWSKGMDPESAEYWELNRKQEQIRSSLPNEINALDVIGIKNGKYTRLTLNRDPEMDFRNVKAQQLYENYYSIDEVPMPLSYDFNGVENLIKARKKFKIEEFYSIPELFEIEASEGDIIPETKLLVRGSKNNKWGVYFLGNVDFKPELVVPMVYDSITVITYNDDEYIYQVWQNGKMGCLDYNYDISIPISYENIELLHLDYTYGAAVKNAEGWILYDLYDNTLLVDEPQKNPTEVLNYWLNNPK